MASGLVAISALAITFGSFLFLGYQHEIGTAEDTAEKVALSLDEHARAVFDGVDSVLRVVRYDLETANPADPAQTSKNYEILSRHVVGQHAVQSLWVANANGLLVGNSLIPITPPIDFSGMAGFQAVRSGAVAEPLVGVPLINPINGRPGLTVSRHLSTPDGKFAGVVTAGLPADFFVGYFRSLQIGEHGVVSLLRADGVVLVRDPANGLVGSSVADTDLFTRYLPESSRGMHDETDPVTGARRISAYRVINGWPLVVSVSIAHEDALAGWRRQVAIYVTLWLLAAITVGGFTAFLMRQAARRSAVERALAAKDAEAHRLRAHMSYALESIADGFILYDADDRLVVINSAARDWHPAVAAAAVPGVATRTEMRRVVEATGMVHNFGDSHFGHDASRRVGGSTIERRVGDRWYRIAEQPTADGGVVVLRTDVTALKVANLALEEAKQRADQDSKAKSEFLATMSREVRTPMNGILGFTNLVLDTKLDPEQRAHLEVVRDSARSLMVVLNDVLDYSRIEAGKLALIGEDFEPAAVAGGVAVTQREAASAKKLDLAVVVAPDTPRLVGDPHRLRQILLNLVGNAIKFTERGRVELRAACEQRTARDATILFEVIDTGIGIAKETQGKLFERFTQADSSTSRRYGGSGLGLSICKGLVELMGGEIGVDSEPGKGSRFWFTIKLPLARSQPAVAANTPDFQPTRTARVLVVDDMELNRRLTTMLLKAGGHAVEAVADGKSAIEAVQARQFDVVLMDVQMPELDGYETTKRIHALPGAADLPIVAMTADAMPNDVERCFAAGMVDHLAKPIEPKTLLWAVERWSRTAPAEGAA